MHTHEILAGFRMRTVAEKHLVLFFVDLKALIFG